jgi:uncharacterized membrane protein
MAMEPNSTQNDATHKWNDRRIEDTVGTLLKCGVLLSALVVFCGAVVYLGSHGSAPANYRVFHGEPPVFRTVRGVIHSVWSFQGRGIIQLGLLLLIATPVARVAFAIWGFAAERDRMYVIFTVIVFIILLYTLIGSI